jgi:hypothetical protein
MVGQMGAGSRERIFLFPGAFKLMLTCGKEEPEPGDS